MKSLKKRFVKIYERALKIDPCLKRLEEAVHNLYEVSDGVSNFLRLLDRENQAQQQQQQLELHRTRETGSSITNDLVGRSKEMEFVRQWLRNPCPAEITKSTDLYSKISLLSVVGHGGMGKTTLLQHVYDEEEVTKEFDVKMWVCVSNNFDPKTVIKNILESLKEESINLGSLEALQRSLKSEVMSKRFLLVLDDIWEVDETKWKNVLTPLHYGSLGSKILVTTRMNSVASEIAKMIKKSKEIFPLKGLEEDECLQLFNIYAFAGVENPNDEFRSIAAKMVEKLSGCPLAAKVIGGILNDYMDECYWKKVLNTNVGNIGSNQNHLLPILKLSYIYLPKFLQNCFAFCCIFPQDHQFDRDDLVRMWMSLGFIQSSDIQGETPEETGRRYFNILVQKSFFDEFRTYYDKVYYKMHDLLHELAQSVSTQECFKVVGDNEFTTPPETIRYLFIYTIGTASLEAIFQKMGKFKNLRSLFLCCYDVITIDSNIISEILKASESIRLLVISAPYILKMPETISCLIHLRYLKVECPLGLMLPRSINHLYQLQFIISERLQNFEMDKLVIKELMPNERCRLIMDELIIKDPSVLLMEPLRSICSFHSLKINKNDELVSFSSETEQWFLQHNSSLLGLNFDELQSLQSLPSSLETLSSLVTLSASNLVSLQRLPSSLSTISSLTYLTLKNIPLLKQLPDLPSSLKGLEIEELESLQCPLSFLSTISSLETLKLKNIPLLKSLSDLPSSLKTLELEALQCLPSSLSIFSSLLHVTLGNIPLLESLPDLPSSLKTSVLNNLESLQCLPSSLSTISSLTHFSLMNIPLLKSLSDLPSSLQYLDLEALESLQRLPSSLSTNSSLSTLVLRKIPLLISLPDLPSSLEYLELEELESLQSLPSSLSTISSLSHLTLKSIPLLKSLQCLPSHLKILWIIRIPQLLELPDLPPSLTHLFIYESHPQLMERYPNFLRRQ